MDQGGGDIFGLNLRDLALAFVAFLFTAMGWIFKKQDNRIADLEAGKVDKELHESRFTEVVRRLDAQDTAAIRRDEKLDKILERVMK